VFVAIGLVCAVWRWRDPRWRVVLIAIAAAPFSAALAEILVTRVLAMMVPATLLITLGLEEVYRRLPGKTPKRIAAGAIAVGLTGWAVWMTSDALRNGPTWFSDYGIDGLQYGARQLFTALAEAHRNDPNRRFLVDISWANNPEAFKEFFLDPEARHAVIFDGLEEFRSRRYDLDDGKTTFVMTKRILDKALETGVVDVIRQSEVLPYPDGSPGFLFVELAYTEAAEGIIAAELERLRAPVHASATVNGEVFDIIHPRLDIGRIEDVFDDNPRTLARTRDANPCRFDLTPNTPIRLAAVSVQLGGDQYKIAVTVIPADGDQPIRIERQFVNLPPDLWITVEIPGGPVRARGLSMTISRPGDGHIHIREIRLE
jgi:hypothetical protein